MATRSFATSARGAMRRAPWGRPCALALVAALALLPLRTAAAPGETVARDRFDLVVIDPGHGGDDHGAQGAGGLLEKDLVLDVAKRLAGQLRAAGLRVILTRDDDRFITLEERTELANEAGADLFLSIHANGARARGARGIETFFASLEATDEAARELAASENLAVRGGEAAGAAASPDDPLLAILGDLMATEHLEESQEFARLAQGRIATDEGARSRGVKQAPFVVLMGVHMPSVLVEIGFLTNARDERTLSRDAERDRLARRLAEAVEAFRVRHDARRGLAKAGAGPAR